MIAQFLLLTALLAGPTVVADDEAVASDIQQIAAKLSELRGLEFRKPIEADVIDHDELLDLLERLIRDELPDELVHEQMLVYGTLGLIDPHADLKAIFRNLMGEQLAGVYDPKEQKLFLVSEDAGVASDEDEMILAHELTHALQDQYFDLDDLTNRERSNDDRILAAACIAEGEATATMINYVIQKEDMGPIGSFLTSKLMDLTMTNADLILGISGAEGKDELSRAPNLLKKQLLFPYSAGLKFVRYGVGRNNWRVMNRVYARPPLSTEQIMHPAKYYRTADWPTDVVMPGITVLLPGKWHMASRMVMGEFGTKVLLEEYPAPFVFPVQAAPAPASDEASQAPEAAEALPTTPALAAAGWDGDEVNVYQNHEYPDELLLIWYTTWDSEKDAEEFEQALAEWIPRRYPDSTPLEGQPQRWNVSPNYVRLERRGSDVLYIDGLHADKHDAIAAALWEKTWKEEVQPKERAIHLPEKPADQ